MSELHVHVYDTSQMLYLVYSIHVLWHSFHTTVIAFRGKKLFAMILVLIYSGYPRNTKPDDCHDNYFRGDNKNICFYFTSCYETINIPYIIPADLLFFGCITIKGNVEISLPPLRFLLFTRGELIFFFIFAILDSEVCGTGSWSEPLKKNN